MRQKLLYFILVFICILNASKNEMTKFSNFDYVNDIVEDGNHLWIGTGEGLVKFNKETENYIVYTKENIGLPHNQVMTIDLDTLNRIWIGGYHNGIGVLNDDTCIVYNSENSGLTMNQIECIRFGSKGNLWIGAWSWVTKFNEVDWKVYFVGLPHSSIFHITDIYPKENGNAWIGTWRGLYEIYNDSIIYHAKNLHTFSLINNEVWGCGEDLMIYRDNNWLKIDTINSGIPVESAFYYQAQVDSKGNIWIGSNKGLLKYDRINWTVFNIDNSNLPVNDIQNLLIDNKDNIWIGRGYGYDPIGLLKFDGVNCTHYHFSYTGVEDDRIKIPTSFFLNQNYPNPFNPSTKIEFGFPKSQNVEINIFSLTGVKIKTLINTIMQAGYHTVSWNAVDNNGTKVSSGVYIYQMKCGNEVFTKKMILTK